MGEKHRLSCCNMHQGQQRAVSDICKVGSNNRQDRPDRPKAAAGQVTCMLRRGPWKLLFAACARGLMLRLHPAWQSFAAAAKSIIKRMH